MRCMTDNRQICETNVMLISLSGYLLGQAHDQLGQNGFSRILYS